MPQFDFYIFLTILNAFIVYFFYIYFLLDSYIIPSFYQLLYFRKLKLVWNSYITSIVKLLLFINIKIFNFYIFNFFNFYNLKLEIYDF